jgi:hypothetical protein
MKTVRGTLLIMLLAASCMVVCHGGEAVYREIRDEALRPNGDPAGLPLPLAARWTCHNFLDGKLSPTGHRVTYPFTMSRVMDDIDKGHRVMPFMGWPRKPGGGYAENYQEFLAGFQRLAATGLPFEIEAGNIEDAMFSKGSAELFWHRIAKENPAHISAGFMTLAGPAAAGEKRLLLTGLKPDAKFKAGQNLLCGSRVHTIAADAAADAQGRATIVVQEAVVAAMPASTPVHVIWRIMDYWSAAPAALWEQAGREMVTGQGADATVWTELAALYPKPPQVQVISNNEGGGKGKLEHGDTSLHAQERASEFAQMFPEPREDSAVRLAFAKGYVEKMGGYFRGIREALPWDADRIKLIGYNAFGVNFEVGRWGGWRGGAIPLGRVDMFPWLAWDGSAPDFYAYDWNYATDEHVGSPHIGSMQAYAMLAPRAVAQVPGYQWQIALWDGGMQRRYRYAGEGTLPVQRTVGRIVESVATTGATSLTIQGAVPGAPLVRTGDMLVVEGHSRAAPVAMSIDIRDLRRGVADKEPEPWRPSTTAEIGQTLIATAAAWTGDSLRVKGGGQILRNDADAIGFVQAPLEKARSIQAIVAGVSTAYLDAVAAEGDAIVPETAQHVDEEAKKRERELASLVSGAKSGARGGVMIRANLDPGAAFVACLRTADGGWSVCQRRGPGGPLEWIDIPKDKTPPATWSVTMRIAITKPGYYEVSWSEDRKGWHVIGSNLHGAVQLGERPLAGIAIAGWNNEDRPLRVYTAGATVTADASGRATIPLSVHDRSGPLTIDDRHGPIAAGATVSVLDYTPRYEGICTMALWLTRPRIIREFAWGDFDEQIEAQWQALLRSVDRIWADPDLTRFWRKGRLVVNPDFEAATGFKHPLWELTDLDPEKRHGPWLQRWQKQDRFHLLTTALNPDFKVWPQRYEVAFHTGPNSARGLIHVWAIAYELGTAPSREWLLITQSPREDRTDVEVTVPGFGKIRVDAERRGSFHLLREGRPGQATAVSLKGGQR